MGSMRAEAQSPLSGIPRDTDHPAALPALLLCPAGGCYPSPLDAAPETEQLGWEARWRGQGCSYQQLQARCTSRARGPMQHSQMTGSPGPRPAGSPSPDAAPAGRPWLPPWP